MASPTIDAARRFKSRGRFFFGFNSGRGLTFGVANETVNVIIGRRSLDLRCWMADMTTRRKKNETGGEDARHPHPPVCRFEGPSLPRG
jgi:hypothetical protein